MGIDKNGMLRHREVYTIEDLITQSKMMEMLVWIMGLAGLVYIDTLGKSEVAIITSEYTFGLSILLTLFQLNELVKIKKTLVGEMVSDYYYKYNDVMKVAVISYTGLYIVILVGTLIGGNV